LVVTWKYIDEEDPTETGWYYVWRMADEGEGHAPAQWSGVEKWDGKWAEGDWGVVQFWDVPFPDAAAAEAAGHAVPNP
jgi:hypothetical protein